MYSIRRHLVLLLISILTCISFLAALQGYKASMQKSSSLFDHELMLLADTLLNLPSTDSPTHILPGNRDFAFQLWHNNTLRFASDNIQHVSADAIENGFSEDNFAGQRWRVYSQLSENRLQRVIIAQPLTRRFSMAEQLILAAVTPVILTIPLLVLLIYLITDRGLAPLRSLSQQLQHKAPGDLQQITLSHPPQELLPVLQTINSLLRRLNNAFLREQRFAADAAHELRTPLSLLKVASHNLQTRQDTDNFASLEQGIERMSHVVNQILLLNRTAPELLAANFTPQDLRRLCQQAISQHYQAILQRHQQIELLTKELSYQTTGNEFALLTMLSNLLSNSNRYTPDGGQIRVCLYTEEQQCVLTVEDSGPGINAEERKHIFERFYRVGRDRHDSEVKGCGLGLSIVQQIAELHQADISLSHSSDLGGLKTEIRFQCLPGGCCE